MGYLSDYLFFNSGNECPETYHLFSSLALASSVIQRKVFLDWGLQRVYPNLYICLVGDQGSRKGVGKDTAKDIQTEYFPNIPIGPSVSSPQAICKELAKESCTMAFKDERDVITEVHSMTFYISELKMFLGVDQMAMLNFLTSAYDDKFIDTNYISREKDIIPNPYLVFLACETPSWILSRLKVDMISGGFARRVLLVYEKALRTRIALPFVNNEMLEARKRVVEHLTWASQQIGPMKWTEPAVSFYTSWYNSLKPPPGKLMEGYYSSKHTQMLKIATILSLVEFRIMELSKECIELSIQILDRIEKNMIELLQGAGRNELAQPTNELLTYLETRGGEVTEKEFRILAGRDMTPYEIDGVINNLVKTERIVVAMKTNSLGVSKKIIFSREKFDSLQGQKPSS